MSVMDVFRSQPKTRSPRSASETATDRAVPLNRRVSDRPLTEAQVRRMYDRPRSFLDKLPWLEYLPASQTLLLEDGQSVGAIIDVEPVGTEGRSDEYKGQIRDYIEAALQDSFEEYDENAGPWIVQFYCYDQSNLDYYLDRLGDYVWPRARGEQFTESFLATMASHLGGAAKPEGLFHDPLTDGPWGAKLRRVHIVVYRRWPKKFTHPAGLTPEQELNDTLVRFCAALSQAGVRTRRFTGRDFYFWMLRWFNPSPPSTEGDREAFYRLADYPGDDNLPFGNDFAEALLFGWPRSEVKTQTWWLDAKPHRIITTQKLRQVPVVGHLTGERQFGTAVYTVFDRLPPDTVLATTIVITPQDVLENHLNYMDRKSVGETAESEATRQDVATAKALLASGHKLFKGIFSVYVRGDDLKDLRARTNAVCNALLGQGIQPVREQDELCGLDAWLLNLPMVYDPALDKNTGFSRYFYAQSLANLSPIFGRSTGTGNPGFTFFNRGGAPLSCDPLNLKDRKKNGHMLLLGPTGAGKSATLVWLMEQVMAIVRPRLFIVEAGNSFGLFADYCHSQGLSTNKVSLKPGSGVSIPPFADAWELVDVKQAPPTTGGQGTQDPTESTAEDDLSDTLGLEELGLEELAEEIAAADNEGDDQRDIMGEMEIIAMLMITGGDEREADKFDRADRRMIRDAILWAARRAVAEGRQTLTQDVRSGLAILAQDPTIKPERQARASYMAECMGLFCDGMEGELFNRPGELWPEVDVTLIDLATYAREGYGGQLAVAYTSIMNRINNLAEKYQNDDRPLVMITDEGHIITTNPLLSPFVVKIVKMWRKLGAWYWVATQNLEDFPNVAKKMLNMIEWWFCLVMPKEEVEHIARFRDLTTEQRQLLLSARKEPGKYTEGVVLASAVEALFRNVPPSRCLALAMTEKDEKVERRQLMRKHGISELDAALLVAQRLDEKRGLA